MNIKTSVPWNKGIAVGQKRPFSQDEILAICDELDRAKRYRDLCLFTLGIDTMLRGSDLVRLRVSDVMDAPSKPKLEFIWNQQKTNNPVVSALTPFTQSVLCCHVGTDKLRQDDFLFSSFKSTANKPLTTSGLRYLVKSWTSLIGLNPEYYSSHSLRRTKPAMLYAHGVRPEMLRLLLGHQNLQSTQSYLGIDQREALELARKHDCFRERPNK